MDVYYIYKLYSTLNPNEMYIGFTNNLEKRLESHLESNDTNSKKLLKKYTKDTIVIEPIYSTKTPVSRLEIELLESEYINSYCNCSEYTILNKLKRNGVYNVKQLIMIGKKKYNKKKY